jgi:hypothetical protein
MLWMRISPFYALVKMFIDRDCLKIASNVSLEDQSSWFVHVVVHNHRFRVIRSIFRKSMETVSRYFKHVLFAVGEL